MNKFMLEYTSGVFCRVLFINASSKKAALLASKKQNIYDITNITNFELETIKHYIYMLAVYNLKQWKKTL